MEFMENNPLFWQKLDTLLLSSKIEIDRPKNSNHPKFESSLYPVNYGFLQDTNSSDGSAIDIFVGDGTRNNIQAIAVCVDTLKRDSEIKVITGCNEEEIFKIMQFLNETEFQKAILVRRSETISDWAIVD